MAAMSHVPEIFRPRNLTTHRDLKPGCLRPESSGEPAEDPKIQTDLNARDMTARSGPMRAFLVRGSGCQRELWRRNRRSETHESRSPRSSGRRGGLLEHVSRLTVSKFELPEAAIRASQKLSSSALKLGSDAIPSAHLMEFRRRL